MPYKFQTDHLKIPRHLDRRVKITPAARARVIRLFKTDNLFQREIARRTGISRRMISFILFPDRLEHAKSLYKKRRLDGRYYPGAKINARLAREHRRYKQSIKDKLIT